MARFKYIQLAIDIKRLLEFEGLTYFNLHTIRNEINPELGFYSYSETTLLNAIKFLKQTTSVRDICSTKGSSRAYFFTPTPKPYVMRNSDTHDTPF